MYDYSGAGAKLRKYTFCSLAWWHSYKWATKELIRVFTSDFIAPLFHHLWPQREFNAKKISHPANTTYLTYIRLAYPRFRNDLEAAVAQPGQNARQKALLTNLTDLCQFFIPVVRHNIYTSLYLNVLVFGIVGWMDI